MKTGFYNIFFRGITLISKFIFIIFLGKYSVDETNLGIYGLIATTIALLIYIIGFDYYIYNTREILNTVNEKIERIKNQLYFHLLAYLIIIPISFFLIFKLKFINVEYLWLLLVLVISEHLGQELYRLFTTLEKSIIANMMLFFRSGLWAWCVIFDFFILKNPINLKKYILLWTIFSWLSFLVFILLLKKVIKISKLTFSKPNWSWIKAGVKTSSVFFIGSLSFLIIQFSDRFMIDYFFDKKLVGVYTTYAQFTNAIDIFTFSVITMVAYPKLIKSFKDTKKYNKIKSQLFKHLILLSTILILLVCLIAPYIFNFLGKELILNEINTFYILLVSVFVLIISNVYHYDLYVKKQDNYIVKAAFIGMLLNVALNMFLIPKLNIFGAAISTLVSYTTILIYKLYFSKKSPE
ncbi:MAG: polysaccharide biosynthesis C-terminal domain-containing protein [Flavobacteriaceae bacterium]|nr:polysaccharide biosynthesis C-terminal domain-containing protein [Flavobacteriaceae bacterium]